MRTIVAILLVLVSVTTILSAVANAEELYVEYGNEIHKFIIVIDKGTYALREVEPDNQDDSFVVVDEPELQDDSFVVVDDPDQPNDSFVVVDELDQLEDYFAISGKDWNFVYDDLPYYTTRDFRSSNMINLEIHYFGLIETKCVGTGVSTKSSLNFVGWIPIYDIIDSYAYFPSKRDIYKTSIDNFTMIESVGDNSSILSAYRTVYWNSSDNRKYNIQLVSSILDGTIIKSGEVFSYNNSTGPRGYQQGYRSAPIIQNGEYVEGYGGGVCQVSSTIYSAIMNNPNFLVVARKPHALEVSYLPYGMDATVAYGGTDFKFKNLYPFDVVLHVSADDGACIVTLVKQ